MNRVVLMLGSNQGDRESNLEAARTMIAVNVGGIFEQSSIYVTEPFGYQSSNAYLNQALVVETELEALELLDITQSIETDLGRVRSQTERYTDRLIDIDIIFLGVDTIVNHPRLTIPHPEIERRAFVLEPLNEIIPHFMHPCTGQTIEKMLLKIKKTQIDS